MLIDGPGAHDATIAEVLLSTPAQSIAGGTDEIQRNIIGDNILGLPASLRPTPTDHSPTSSAHE